MSLKNYYFNSTNYASSIKILNNDNRKNNAHTGADKDEKQYLKYIR